ncbi:MAG: bifunctional glycosyltransferase/class I SAM-dependent methyltransferase [Pseudomonadota bacterium]
MKQRVLIFIVAYNAEKTIESVLARIPSSLAETFDVEILAIDDASADRTFELGHAVGRSGRLAFPLRVLVNPVNQGYGGNQKLGYEYAIRHGFDFVVLLHGDGQYAPEILGELLAPLAAGRADAVFGSRMMVAGAARRGGMPLYKRVGNRILTWAENRLLGTALTEFHSGYRIYSVEALRQIPFQKNTNDFHFDTQIIIQLVIARKRIVELPIPTYYGDEICHVNGMRYAKDVMVSVMKARAQQYSIVYDPKFDCAPQTAGNAHYQLKLGYESTHQAVLDLVQPEHRVLDLGCAGGWLSQVLKTRKRCRVHGVDTFALGPGVVLDQFVEHDLNAGLPPLAAERFDYVLLLDVIEHMHSPEALMADLRVAMSRHPGSRLVITTGNVAFLPVRLMLLLGQFNYGKRGILDLTHTRLFTFRSMRRLLHQAGFEIESTRGIAAPFPLAFGEGRLGMTLSAINSFFARILRSMFSYQMMFIAKATPMVTQLLDQAQVASVDRASEAREPVRSPAMPLPALDRAA